jgi:porphobilinogen synthase
MRELRQDVAEGADLLLVKPGLPCLDHIAAARRAFDLPIAAYQVSGEYAMIAAAAERGWIDGRRVLLESVTSIARAGADIVITYGAADLASWIAGERVPPVAVR